MTAAATIQTSPPTPLLRSISHSQIPTTSTLTGSSSSMITLTLRNSSNAYSETSKSRFDRVSTIGSPVSSPVCTSRCCCCCCRRDAIPQPRQLCYADRCCKWISLCESLPSPSEIIFILLNATSISLLLSPSSLRMSLANPSTRSDCASA